MKITSEPKSNTARLYSFSDIQQIENWAFDRGLIEGQKRAKAARLERIKALQEEHRMKVSALALLISLEA